MTELETKIVNILADKNGRHYFSKDKEIAESLSVNRATVASIRIRNDIKNHRGRLLEAITDLPTASMYITEIVEALLNRVSYICVYKVVESAGVPVLRRGKND